MIIWEVVERCAAYNCLDVDLTLLGIDIQHKGTVYADLNEITLQHLSDYDGPRLLLLSPMGGQGFLIGRGNLQLSPDVLVPSVGFDSWCCNTIEILGFQVSESIQVMYRSMRNSTTKVREITQGYRTTRVIRVLEA